VDLATLRFYGELSDYLPKGERTASVGVDDGPSVKDRIEACGVPHPEVDLIVVDGEPVGFGHHLAPGDRVAVYPVFRSLDVRCPLRPDAPVGRFAVDINLGRLAKYLRLLGFDAVSDGRLDDGDLAELAVAEDRIVLTRDRHLLKRSIVVHGYLVREVMPVAQAGEVLRRFGLADRISPFARCMECNGVIVPVAKAEVDHLLEPLTREHFDEFRRCSGCGRVFWRGSHFDRLAAVVAGIRRSVAPSG
jgi:uncharacterized protein with PIN domain